MNRRVAAPRIVLAAVFLSGASAALWAADLVAPASLSAAAESSSQIRLSWVDSNTNETGSSIERSLSAISGFAVVGTVGKGVSSYVDTGRSAATTYFYRVRASGRRGATSPYSNVASTTTPAVSAQVPAAPSGASAVAVSSVQINLSWTDNSSNETGFKVERATSSAGPWGQIGTTGGVAYSDSGLASSTPYWYRIRAWNSAGDSGYSNSASATTQATATVPIAPSNLSAVAVSAAQVNLTWRDNSSDEAGFKVERAPSSAGPWGHLGLAAWGAVAYVDTVGLSPSTTYWYRVRAYNGVGDSGYSNTASATTSGALGSGTHLWSEHFGGPYVADSVFPLGVAVDGVGEVAMTGFYQGSPDLGTGALANAGGNEIFVAKYDSSGTPLWSRRIGNSFDDRGKAIAVDSSGNVFVTGYFRGTVDFGGTPVTSAPSTTQAFLVKYSPTGGHLWSKKLNLGGGVDEGAALAVDGGGNVLVGGIVYQTSDFGGGPLTSAGGADIFLAKFTATGAHVWSKRVGGTGDDRVNAVAVDGQGNLAMTGYFNGSVDFGAGALNSAGGKDVFLAQYSSSGAHVWSRRFGGASDETGRGVAIGSAGNVVIAGNFASSSVDFGGGALANAGGADIFLAQYASNGSHLWSRRFGGSLSLEEIGTAVATDGAGNIVLTGSVVDTIDFGGGPLTTDGYYDIFVAKFNGAGAHQWSKRTGAGAGEKAATDSGGNVVVAGDFTGSSTVNFGGANLSSPGGTDAFLVKLGP